MSGPSGLVATIVFLSSSSFAQPVVDSMPLEQVAICGRLALQLQTLRAEMTATDGQLAVEGRAIRAESKAVDLDRTSVKVRDARAVARFNARVAALNARVAGYATAINVRNAKAARSQPLSTEYNIKCAGRPYSPDLLKDLPPAEATALAKIGHTVEEPMLVNPDLAANSGQASTTEPGPPPVVIGGEARQPGTGEATPGSTTRFRSLEDLHAAAEKGSADAQFTLGQAYLNGDQVPRDDIEARKWLEEAAKQKHATANYQLAMLYHEGRGVDVNDRRYFEYLSAAAELGDANAEHNLALWYSDRNKSPEDRKMALRWMEKAADQGAPDSQYVLSEFYRLNFSGRGDDELSLTWVRRSAVQGFSSAQLALGKRYEDGAGVDKNRIEALKWYLLASRGGDAEAPHRCVRLIMENARVAEAAKTAVNRLQARLAPYDIDNARALAKAWVPTSETKVLEAC